MHTHKIMKVTFYTVYNQIAFQKLGVSKQNSNKTTLLNKVNA